ncbi:stress protein [Desulfonema ishimotonii]|uniref:Stress protein n=1 Tax=Desulfonema ishimotonii TaxID=45657 RepID=A0A401FXU8_9BACT|nr:type I restriction enzyme HsdR N-terminal domain-containing protein [Desulfonema ishimotonii]GBC61832.1 stress protein [Desulfonema ishimotonii]
MWTKCTNDECAAQFEVSNDKFGQIVTCEKCGNKFRATFSIDPSKSENTGTQTRKKSGSTISTMCPNLECGQKYKVKADMIGSVARCKKCNTVFNIEEYVETEREITLEIEDKVIDAPQEEGNKKRQTAKEVMAKKMERISNEVDLIIPLLMDSLEKKENESDTRLLIDSMLQNILGYDIADIKTEQKIEGKRADYVLSVKGKDCIVIEAKRTGMNLREKQIFQAAAYGAFSGIKWVLLTNALVWQLYRISTGEKIEHNLIFTIDLLDGLDNEEAEYFYLISKDGMSRKNLLDNLWQKIRALSEDNIVDAILSDGVITKIRTALIKQTGYKKIDNNDLRQHIEEKIFQLS